MIFFQNLLIIYFFKILLELEIIILKIIYNKVN